MLTEFTTEQGAILDQVKRDTDVLSTMEPGSSEFVEKANTLLDQVLSNSDLLKTSLYFDGLPYITYMVQQNSAALNLFCSDEEYLGEVFFIDAVVLDDPSQRMGLLHALSKNTDRSLIAMGINTIYNEPKTKEEMNQVLEIAEQEKNIFAYMLVLFRMERSIYRGYLDDDTSVAVDDFENPYNLVRKDIVKALSEMGINPNKYYRNAGLDWYGIEFLWTMMVVRSDRENLLRLLDKGVHHWPAFQNMRSADCFIDDEPDQHGTNLLTINDPFFIAAALGKTDIVQMLIGHGIDSTYTDAEGVSALRIAVATGHWETAQCLAQDRMKKVEAAGLTRMGYASLVKRLSNVEPSEGVGAAAGAGSDGGRRVRRRMAVDEQRAVQLVKMMRNAAGENEFFKYASDSEEKPARWKDVGSFLEYVHVPTEYKDLLAYAVMAEKKGQSTEVERVKNVVCGFYGMNGVDFDALVSSELVTPLFAISSEGAGSANESTP